MKRKFSCRTRISTVISVGKLHNKENDVRNAQTMENNRGIPDTSYGPHGFYSVALAMPESREDSSTHLYFAEKGLEGI